MTGTFELFTDKDMCFRFRLNAPDGTVMAVSRSFPDKPSAVAGISAVREYAGMGLITDLCTEVSARGSSTGTHPPGTGQEAPPSAGGPPSDAPQRTPATGQPAPYGPTVLRRAPAAAGLQKVA